MMVIGLLMGEALVDGCLVEVVREGTLDVGVSWEDATSEVFIRFDNDVVVIFAEVCDKFPMRRFDIWEARFAIASLFSLKCCGKAL